jgi:thioredoxin-related protein
MNKSVRTIIVILFSLISLSSFAQKKINWMSWDQMIEKEKVEKRKVIVDLYTDWCGWCKRMDKTTFTNPVIVDYINKHYYAVKFNAEQKEDVEFDGTVYKFVKSGRRGYHELAAALTQNNLSYPTYVFLTEDIALLQVLPGYRSAKDFEYIINYFGEDYFKTTPWSKFEKEFQPKL